MSSASAGKDMLTFLFETLILLREHFDSTGGPVAESQNGEETWAACESFSKHNQRNHVPSFINFQTLTGPHLCSLEPVFPQVCLPLPKSNHPLF
jgi:hypothetical protein